MQFRTEIPVKKAPFPVEHGQPLLFWGSCFSEHIAALAGSHGFQAMANPLGIVYNPVSAARQFLRLRRRELFTEKDFFRHGERWQSFALHSQCAAASLEAAVDENNHRLTVAADQLEKTDCLFFTPGTAWVYAGKESGDIVANCHKLPAQQFTKRLLTLEEIVQSLEEIVAAAPQARIVFTLSPVRHLKDGFVENMHSKSLLHVALQQITEQHSGRCFYFPAYELLLDELRDYRFYTDDLLHPNAQAIQYIWEHFAQVFFSETTGKLAAEVAKLHRMQEHRPFQPESAGYRLHLEKIILLREKLLAAHPGLVLQPA